MENSFKKLFLKNFPGFLEIRFIFNCFFQSDPYLSQNTWKIHEEFSLMIDDLNRDIPHPARRRSPVFWTQQNPLLYKVAHQNHSYQQISVANGIFFQNGYSIRDDFRSAIESAYKSTLQRLDFANKAELSSKYINRFVDFQIDANKFRVFFLRLLNPIPSN